MSFKDYLAKRRITDTPAGDFTKDARRDKKLPEIESWTQLEAYLGGRMAGSDAIAAGRAVWRGYEKSLKKR